MSPLANETQWGMPISSRGQDLRILRAPWLSDGKFCYHPSAERRRPSVTENRWARARRVRVRETSKHPPCILWLLYYYFGYINNNNNKKGSSAPIWQLSAVWGALPPPPLFLKPLHIPNKSIIFIYMCVYIHIYFSRNVSILGGYLTPEAVFCFSPVFTCRSLKKKKKKKIASCSYYNTSNQLITASICS